MAELNLDVGYPDHIKTTRLIERLGEYADVFPMRLCCYVGRHYPESGRLVGLTPEEVEKKIGWRGKPRECFDALCEVGFIDTSKHGCVVHGWLERSGHLSAFAKRARKAARTRWSKERENKKRPPKSDAQASSSICPNPTQPTNPTNPTNVPNPTNARARAGSGGDKGESGMGSGGLGRDMRSLMRGLAPPPTPPDGDSERLIQVQSRLSRLGVNHETQKELIGRHDVTPARIDAELADIRAGPGVEDVAGVLVHRLRANGNGRRTQRARG